MDVSLSMQGVKPMTSSMHHGGRKSPDPDFSLTLLSLLRFVLMTSGHSVQ